MSFARLALVLALGAVLAACGGETEVEGANDAGTGPTAETGTTGPTGPTATGPTAAGAFGGPVSIDTSAAEAAGMQAALYSCDGAEGTWTYILRGGPIDYDIEETFSMEGGDGTLVISDEFSVGGISVSFTDTIELEIAGSPDAPTMRATSVQVDVEGNVPGVSDELFEGLFAEGQDLPILEGAEEC